MGRTNTDPSARRTFHTLDGLRGVAALAVVCFHCADQTAPFTVPSAYLAVDLFFLMSGFVLAHAYGARLRGGLGAGRFMAMRFVRLYPLYILGTLVGLVFPAAALLAGVSHAWTWGAFLAEALPALVLLPGPPVAGHDPVLYHFDIPAWSLVFELAANLLWAVTAWRSERFVGLITMLVALLYVIAAAMLSGGLDIGWRWPEAGGALARVGFSFFLGVAFHRWCAAGRFTAPRVPPMLLLVATAILLLVAPPAAWRPLYDLACVLVAFPAIVWLGIASEPGRGRGAFTVLGLVSYPIYVLHVPCLQAFERVVAPRLPVHTPWTGVALVAGMIALSWGLARSFDPWVRARLGAAWPGHRRVDAPAAGLASSS